MDFITFCKIKFILVVFAVCVTTTSFSQNITKFSNDVEKFLDQLDTYVESSNKDDVKILCKRLR